MSPTSATPLRLVNPFPVVLQSESATSISLLTRLDARVRQVIKLLLEDLAKPHRLDDLAKAIHLCPRQLERLFQQETHFTPLQYLKRLRLEKAAALLITTDKEIIIVREEVGLVDASHFARDFKRHFGLPPARYRKQRRGK